jgi:hypothetical protein
VTLIEDEERPWETANPPAAAITTAPRARTFHARGVTQRISTCVGDSEITQPGDAPVQASLMRLVPGSGAYIDARLRQCSGMSLEERVEERNGSRRRQASARARRSTRCAFSCS